MFRLGPHRAAAIALCGFLLWATYKLGPKSPVRGINNPDVNEGLDEDLSMFPPEFERRRNSITIKDQRRRRTPELTSNTPVFGHLPPRSQFVSEEIVDLSVFRWRVRNDNGSIDAGAKVPGGIYTDLERAGILRSVYYRFNDVEYRWVSKQNWTYSTSFSLPEKMRIFHKIMLSTISDHLA